MKDYQRLKKDEFCNNCYRFLKENYFMVRNEQTIECLNILFTHID